VGLAEVADKGPGKFSLGMAQRLGIAAAILDKPKYLILDQPANGLDPEGIAWLRQFIKDYADLGNAVFISSHLLSEMSQMADDLVVIGKGKLIANTSMQSIIDGSTHSSVFVRSTNKKALEAALSKANLTFTSQDNGLAVQGAKTDEVGNLVFDAGIPVLELANKSASLEEAFLELTSGSEEYQARTTNAKEEK
jgi:ABC-2 type transport system ATP-binding protein